MFPRARVNRMKDQLTNHNTICQQRTRRTKVNVQSEFTLTNIPTKRNVLLPRKRNHVPGIWCIVWVLTTVMLCKDYLRTICQERLSNNFLWKIIAI